MEELKASKWKERRSWFVVFFAWRQVGLIGLVDWVDWVDWGRSHREVTFFFWMTFWLRNFHPQELVSFLHLRQNGDENVAFFSIDPR